MVEWDGGLRAGVSCNIDRRLDADWHSLEAGNPILIPKLLRPFHVNIRVDRFPCPFQIGRAIRSKVRLGERGIEGAFDAFSLRSHLTACSGDEWLDWLSITIGEHGIKPKRFLQIIEPLPSQPLDLEEAFG